MRRLGVIVISLLLAGVICLQILSALNIFPRTRIIQVCPVDAISMKNGKAVIDPTKCIGCKRCVVGVASLIPPKREAVEAPVAAPPATAVNPADETPKADEAGNVTKPQVSQPTKNKEVTKEKSTHVRLVNSDDCIGCQLCVANCPDNAIRMVDGKAVIDPEKCTDCGICELGNIEQGGTFNGCPTSAISRVKRAEGK